MSANQVATRIPIDLKAESGLESRLLHGEDVLWVGQPDRSVRFTAMDILWVPLTLAWGGFAIFWEALVIAALVIEGPQSRTFHGSNPLVFVFWGIPFVVIGLYMIFGRFVYKDLRKRRTYYAVTDRRLLALTRGADGSYRELPINSELETSKSIVRNGIGTISFANRSAYGFLWSQLHVNSGLPISQDHPRSGRLVFYDVRDVEDVCRLVEAVKSGVHIGRLS